MSIEKYILLIHKEIEQSISDTEAKELRLWISSNDENAKLYKEILKTWELTEQYPTASLNIDVDRAYNTVQKRLTIESKDQSKSASIRPMYVWLSVAASLALVLGFFWMNHATGNTNRVEIYATTSGHKVTLPDNSVAILQKGSSLSYDRDTHRGVDFSGSAYFDIVRDTLHPFKIKGGNSTVEVLGTSFMYEDIKGFDRGFVKMLSGIVKLTVGEQSAILTNTDAFSFGKGNITKSKISPSQFEWYKHNLKFDSKLVAQVIGYLEGYYGVQISYSQELSQCKFTGDLSGSSIVESLEVLAGVFNAKFTQHDKKYILSDGSCD